MAPRRAGEHDFVERPSNHFDARAAEQLLGPQVPLGDLSSRGERDHGVEGVLDDQPRPFLARGEGAFRAAAFRSAFGLTQFPLDGSFKFPGQASEHAVVIAGYARSGGGVSFYVNDPWPYDAFPGQTNPYLAGGGVRAAPGQFLISSTALRQRLALRETIYGIQ